MKNGKTLDELAREIMRQQESKKDVLTTTGALTLFERPAEAGGADLAVGGEPHPVGIKPLAHRQIGEHLGIPAKYYDRMLHEAPGLLVANANHWLHANPTKRLVRMLDGKVRAFLSDGYRPLEYCDLAEAVLPVLLELGVDILSCEITETRLYIKAVDIRIRRDLPSGKRMGDGSHCFFDTSSPAIVISNSEVGLGMLSVETAVWTEGCTNMAIFKQHSMKKRHLGARHELVDDKLYTLLSDETRKVTDKAIWLQVKDVVKGSFEEARFDARINEMKGMAEQPIEGDPVKVVEFASKKFGVSEGEKTSILQHLIRGGDLTRYGLFNAVTRTAEDLPDYDRATEFERLGGEIIDLPQSEWQEVAKAA